MSQCKNEEIVGITETGESVSLPLEQPDKSHIIYNIFKKIEGSFYPSKNMEKNQSSTLQQQ